MTTLFGVLAVILTVAIIFGRRVARWLVIVGLICCIAVALCIGGYLLYTTHEQDVRNQHVEFAISHLPPGISDADKGIMRQELQNYFAGLYDKQHVPDLDMIDQYLQSINPSLVRRK
jgi:hypothetical protein